MGRSYPKNVPAVTRVCISAPNTFAGWQTVYVIGWLGERGVTLPAHGRGVARPKIPSSRLTEWLKYAFWLGSLA